MFIVQVGEWILAQDVQKKRGPALLKDFYSRTVDNLFLESSLESSLACLKGRLERD